MRKFTGPGHEYHDQPVRLIRAMPGPTSQGGPVRDYVAVACSKENFAGFLRPGLRLVSIEA